MNEAGEDVLNAVVRKLVGKNPGVTLRTVIPNLETSRASESVNAEGHLVSVD